MVPYYVRVIVSKRVIIDEIFSSLLGLRVAHQAVLKAPFLFDMISVVQAVHTIECSFDQAWLLSVLMIRWIVFHADVHSNNVASASV